MRNRRVRIKLISIFFAAIAVGIFTTIVVFVIKTKKTILPENSIDTKENLFSRVRFKTYNRQGKEINIKSDSVHENKKDNYLFRNMVSNFALSNGERLKISSNVIYATREYKRQCEFLGNVRLSTDSGFIMKTEQLFVDFDKKIARGNTSVEITQDNTRVSAKKCFFDMNKNTLTLIGNVNGFIKLDKINSDTLVIHFDNIYGKNIQNIDALGNATYTTKDYLLKARKSITYSPNEIRAQENVILVYKKSGNRYDVRSNSMRAQINNGLLDHVEANNSLTIKTNNAIIRADRGILKDDKIKVSGNVAISGKQGNVLGRSATLDMKTGDVFILESSGVVDDGTHKND
ncbi:MAG: LPS export ABC transporter periplasmic protein LptC [Holosporaceae bacterium]|nr:LPS export ABC transporter periplasmic protein LptC [Holosporaceae bacterium]